MTERDLDLVLYGATGFTGRLAAAYLGAHAPATLRWGIAGRDPTKLEALARDLERAACPPRERLRADAKDVASIEAMTRRARVIVSTAGPFATFSDPVVSACVAGKTDYVDITGETPWVRTLLERHHERAAADGTRIVPCCGFDSVPSDLGAWMMMDWVRRTWQEPTAQVTTAFAVRGAGVNGGTVASALLMAETGQTRQLLDPLLLVPGEARDAVDATPPRRSAGRDDALDAWLAPFIMAPINGQIVLRSAAVWATRGAPYGPRFRYDEGLEMRGGLSARLVAAGMAIGDAAMRGRAGRALVRRLAPDPGQGPSEEAMQRGRVRCRYLAETPGGRRALGRLEVEGDPGNRATVLLLCEGALGLALDRAALPPGGGVLTPATALGATLLERLRRAGVRTSVEPLGPT
jgi:short subunit dehydrogenase-like uncharacterized protein